MAPAEPQPAIQNAQPPAPGTSAPPPNVPVSDGIVMDRTQIIQLLSHIPGIFPKGTEGNLKEDAAQILSNLSQQNYAAAAAAVAAGQLPHGLAPPPGAPGFPSLGDPGPSSHPRGPPNLGQLSAVAMQAAPAPAPQRESEGEGDDMDGNESPAVPTPVPGAPATGARRGGRGGAAMGSDEWTRQRKDNHKEVERRRRGNINEGINELGRIVPNGSGEKSKGAILSRAVQYIHHLKENEARNIEKWTLEKLLMDQAMGDLQAQLEDMRRAWEEERGGREKVERELQELKKNSANASAGTKRSNEEGEEKEDEVKRQRTE